MLSTDTYLKAFHAESTALAAAARLGPEGSASDLLLFLWHRIQADRLQVSGERSLVARYFQLVPPD